MGCKVLTHKDAKGNYSKRADTVRIHCQIKEKKYG